MIFCPDGIIPHSGLTGPNNIYIYVYIEAPYVYIYFETPYIYIYFETTYRYIFWDGIYIYIYIETSYIYIYIYIWRSKDEVISDVLLWTPTYGCAKVGRPARTYIQQLCEDTGCNPEDLTEAMNDREKWRERVRDIRAGGATWWWWWYIYIFLVTLYICIYQPLRFCRMWHKVNF